jgi:hypothetical protein
MAHGVSAPPSSVDLFFCVGAVFAELGLVSEIGASGFFSQRLRTHSIAISSICIVQALRYNWISAVSRDNTDHSGVRLPEDNF